MSGGSYIVAIGAENSAQDAHAETGADESDTLSLDEAWVEEAGEGAAFPHRSGWIIPTLACFAVLGWTGFFTFVNQREILVGGTPQQWSEWIISWSAPVLLVIALWLLAMRSSKREASRFADAAQALSHESSRLEQRLITVNRELSLAREFIASQGRDLEAFGRVASERLSSNADHLHSLIHQNDSQIQAIASVSQSALENIEKLRGDLPVIANSARDVTSQIGNAGRTAHSQLNELVSGFHRLNEFGEASERQVEGLRLKVDSALVAFENHASRLEDITQARFAALEERSEAFRGELDSREVEVLAALRRRSETLGEELRTNWSELETQEAEALQSLRTRITSLRDESSTLTRDIRLGESGALDKWNNAVSRMGERLQSVIEEVDGIDAKALEEARKRLDTLNVEAQHVEAALAERSAAFDEDMALRRTENEIREQEATDALERRLTMLDDALTQRQEEHLAYSGKLAERGDALAEHLAGLSVQIENISAHGSETSLSLSAALETLSSGLAESSTALSGTDEIIAQLTDASVRLLELIQAGATHSRQELPSAIDNAKSSLSEFEERARALNVLLGEAGEKGRSLSDYVLAAQRDGRAAMDEVDAAHQKFATHGEHHAEQIESLRHSLSQLGEDSDQVAQKAKGELTDAIAQLQGAARLAVSELDSGSAAAVHTIASKLGEQSAAAVEQAMRQTVDEAIDQLEKAATHASGTSREAAIQLRDQLAKVNELTGNLEQRVAIARERAEDQVDNDFARRVALITECLHSNAIDIAKAMSNDVTDTAWASYLRGDRGIFTRRAVRLLDNSEAREIAEIYDRDGDFRGHVNRYISDFEGMLRTMLSTRDGNALAVTLLSSDMGKLYVALAQAIERLRS